jgi:hypothetical protein
MSVLNSYTFNNLGRIGADATDSTQQNVYNTRFANYTLSNYFSESLSGAHVAFATSQPSVMFNGVNGGSSVGGASIDVDSLLMLNREQERSFEKLSLVQRPFLTVPYLGKGSCDPALESQLQQGELSGDKKSTSTVMEQSFMNYSLYPTDAKMKERVQNPAYSVEESALDGWVRGGMTTREMSTDKSFSKNNRPTDKFF